jgi:hypothetical protein
VDSERSEPLHGWAFDQEQYRPIALTLFPKRLSTDYRADRGAFSAPHSRVTSQRTSRCEHRRRT